MIRHVAVFSWLPEATPERRREASEAIATLPPLMTGLRAFAFGADAGLSDGNADFVVVADFDDAESYLAYRDHPAHQEVIKSAIRPITRQRMAIQFEI